MGSDGKLLSYKALADLLGVDKSKVTYRARSIQGNKEYVTLDAETGTHLLTDKGQAYITKRIGTNRNDKSSKATQQTAIDLLTDQLQTKDKQLAQLQQQLDTAEQQLTTKDKQQQANTDQLTVMTQQLTKLNEQLSIKDTQLTDLTRLLDQQQQLTASVQAKLDTAQQLPAPRQGLFARLFGHHNNDN